MTAQMSTIIFVSYSLVATIWSVGQLGINARIPHWTCSPGFSWPIISVHNRRITKEKMKRKQKYRISSVFGIDGHAWNVIYLKNVSESKDYELFEI